MVESTLMRDAATMGGVSDSYTSPKRKLDDDPGDPWGASLGPQAKMGRLGGAAAASAGDWGVDSTSAALATSLLSESGDSDEEEDEDDVEEGGYRYAPYEASYHYCATRPYWPATSPTPAPTPAPAASLPPLPTGPPHTQAAQQQTIRCDKNGKSYLDLGSLPLPTPPAAALAPSPCCDGSRHAWCVRGPGSCYRQRRLAVLNMSMCKLSRYRAVSDPSLRRSVLICNTLRLLEREMEQDGCFFGGGGGGGTAAAAAAAATAVPTPPPSPAPQPQAYAPLMAAEESLRPTPFPSPVHPGCDADLDSGLGDDDPTRGINWGSVLSLSSQSDLDPLNNNELFRTSSATSVPPPSTSPVPSHADSLGLLADEDLTHEFDDFPFSWKMAPLSADDLLKTTATAPGPDLDLAL